MPGYSTVVVSLKEPGRTPGDASSDAMELVADLAERFSHSEARVNYTQNLMLPHVATADIVALYDILAASGLATGNYDLLGDMICCPGLDYCNLANARSIPIAKEIAKRFEDPKRQELIGPLRLNMSGCINACGHHHSGNIGILGVDKKGTELYQISLGGNPKDDAAIGTIIGPGFRAEAVPQAIDTIIETYLARRERRGDLPRHLAARRGEALQGGPVWLCLISPRARSYRPRPTLRQSLSRTPTAPRSPPPPAAMPVPSPSSFPCSMTDAASALPCCCASATASRERSGRSAISFPTSPSFCCARASTPP